MFLKHLKTHSTRILATALLSVTLATPASADEIYVVSSSQLLRLDSETGAQELVGAPAPRVAALTFTPGGILIAAAKDGSLHSVDPLTAATTELLGPGSLGLSFSGDLVAGPVGFVYGLQPGTNFTNELRRIDLITGAVRVIGPVHRADPDAPRTLLRRIYFFNGALVATGFEEGNPGTRLFSVSPSTGAVAPIANPELDGGPLADFDSQGNFWVDRSVGIIAPPFWQLVAIDPATGEPAAGTPVLEPFFGSNAFALRPEARALTGQEKVPSSSSLAARHIRAKVND